MCGIIGSLGKKPNHAWVKNAKPFLKHRGPDSFHYKTISDFLVLGAARLAMTDPHPRSDQPLTDKESGNAIVFNGEIYNYRELRAELVISGYSFKTDSDTEVLLAGLTLQGLSFLPKLNGMFAFCFFDAKNKIVILARDALGKKPLYYTLGGDTFQFSSSQKALRSITESQIRNENGILDFLLVGYLIDPATSITPIQSVYPGEVLSVEINPILKVTRTKIGPFQNEEPPTNLRESLTLATKRRIEGHNRVAISLSGGLDSTLIALILSEIGSKAVAFSASWPDSDKSRYNHDSEIASRTALKLGLEFQCIEVFRRDELEEMLNLYLTVMEEPNNNSTGLSMLNIYQSMKTSDFRLALTGDGADEIFNGYTRYSYSARIPNFFKFKSLAAQGMLLNQKNQKFASILSSQLDLHQIAKYLKWHLIFTPYEISLLNPKISSGDITQRLLSDLTAKINLDTDSTIENFMNFDSQLWLSMESNRRLDRISMRYSLEARSPFQDESVRAIAKALINAKPRIPSKREILVNAFPELSGIKLQQEKIGFISPIGHWLRGNRELTRRSLEFLRHNRGFSRQILDHLEGAPDRGNFSDLTKLWTLVVLGQWSMNHEN